MSPAKNIAHWKLHDGFIIADILLQYSFLPNGTLSPNNFARIIPTVAKSTPCPFEMLYHAITTNLC